MGKVTAADIFGGGNWMKKATPATPPMTPERVKQTGRQFGQKIGGKEAKAIARILAPRPWDKN